MIHVTILTKSIRILIYSKKYESWVLRTKRLFLREKGEVLRSVGVKECRSEDNSFGACC